jgi:cyclopropane fatty-acyl-phospholipid synthase-like methyltransferase
VVRPYASAAARNAAPILGVLRHELRDRSTVFEIGSGTAQHAVTFAAALPGVTWQTSDLVQSHDGIRAWIEEAGLGTVLPPLEFDVLSARVPGRVYDAVFSANTAPIMSYAAVRRMFALVGAMLGSGGVFCLYGPFSRGGSFSTASNEAFHASLRSRNPAMGIRDLDDLDDVARESGMVPARMYAMPANNLLVVWVKREYASQVSPISD